MVKFSNFLQVVAHCDTFPHEFDPSSQEDIHNPANFYLNAEGIIIGLVVPPVKAAMKAYNEQQEPAPFVIGKDVTFAYHINTFDTRTAAVKAMVDTWRRDSTFVALKGWRNELYPVYGGKKDDKDGVTFVVERAAAPLFGIATFGAHVNAFKGNPKQQDTCQIWVARRALTKQTWPGVLDNCVAGGISYGDTPEFTVIKECDEEASIREDVASRARKASKVSYFTYSENGLEPETQCVFDLPLDDVEPTPRDGEVQGFYLWSIDKVKETILNGEWKPDCALVMIEFMMRHEHITKDNEPDYDQILRHIYRKHIFPGPSWATS